MKERFEKGEIYEGDSKSTFKEDEFSVFEQGIIKGISKVLSSVFLILKKVKENVFSEERNTFSLTSKIFHRPQ